MSKLPRRGVIRLRGVRHNNLKNFDLDLPLNRLIVVTGLSGSGKSSLAFDTLFAEGQRRYIETFSPYARQFFDRMDKPQVDSVEGIPPAIAIEQRNSVRTTRSTVGTMTEICDHMKVLWPHLAHLHCRSCGERIRKDTPRSIWAALGHRPELAGKDLLVTFELPLTQKLSLDEMLSLVARQGYQRVIVEGTVLRLEEAMPRLRARRQVIERLQVVQDRLRLTMAHRSRFIEACEQAYHFGKGALAVQSVPEGAPANERPVVKFSNRLHCARCDIEYPEPSPALFSFNHPVGACPTCRGFGRIISIDYSRAMPDTSRTLAQCVVKPWLTGMSAECQTDLLRVCRRVGIPIDVPFRDLDSKWQRFVVDGEPGYGTDAQHEWPKAWYGVKGYFRWLESRAYKMHVRVLLSRYRAYTPCPDCHGARFRPDSLLYRVPVASPGSRAPGPSPSSSLENTEALTLAAFYALPIRDALRFIRSVRIAEADTHNRTERARAIGVGTSPSLLADARLSRETGTRTSLPQAPSFAGTSASNSAIELVLSEVISRLEYLEHVGLGYLTLDRPTRSLSGGETERVNLTTCLGSRLVNTLFVLDEPSVGLHPRDTERLVNILLRLRSAGNTVVVVEHEAAVMRAADEIIDLGPGHGATGGNVVFQGTFGGILKCDTSLTGQYLAARRQVPIPKRRPVRISAGLPAAGRYAFPSQLPALALNDRSRTAFAEETGLAEPRNRPDEAHPVLRLEHARKHNLQDVSVTIPLERFVCVTGVSGSGKTTLVREVLLPALSSQLHPEPGDTKASDRLADESANDEEDERESEPARTTAVTGAEQLRRVVLVDQAILGKTPRSNPAVYIGAFDDIRELFAQSDLARRRGLKASAFSFNSAQGQCERCRGAGFEKIEMQFLSDVYIRCPDCDGRRYRAHILEIELRPPDAEARPNLARGATEESYSIADLLEATVEEACDFLSRFPNARARNAVQKLHLLNEVGLGYLRLGQPINTLSGGECQRLKLVRHLADVAQPASIAADGQDRILFLFDEPTTGLHFEDVGVLLKVFQRLVNAGHSLLVIEHNLDVIKCADWVIDLGPDAGDQGGQLVAQGTPEEIAECPGSATGRALKGVISSRGERASTRPTRTTRSPRIHSNRS